MYVFVVCMHLSMDVHVHISGRVSMCMFVQCVQLSVYMHVYRCIHECVLCMFVACVHVSLCLSVHRCIHGLCMCMYICVRVCIHAGVSGYIYVNACIYGCVHMLCVCAMCVCVCMCAFMDMCMHVHPWACAFMGEGVRAAPSSATCSLRCLPHSSLRHTFRLENTDAFFLSFSPH